MSEVVLLLSLSYSLTLQLRNRSDFGWIINEKLRMMIGEIGVCEFQWLVAGGWLVVEVVTGYWLVVTFSSVSAIHFRD